MLKSIALSAAGIGLKLLAPKAGNTIDHIQTVARIALPIVERCAALKTDDNDMKWARAMNLTKAAIGEQGAVKELVSDNIVESGVQLAYSIFTASRK